MNILTIYTKNAGDLLCVLDDIARKLQVKVLAADPERLYNDENHEDINMPSITFSTDTTYEGVVETIYNKQVFVCEEIAEDWE